MQSLQDAFDAVGYFELALAAALEDQANPEALYVVYMKLAEIHGNHMPDVQLCQVYRDRAQSLKRVLAGEENMGNADTESGQNQKNVSDADMEHTESSAERNVNENCEDDSFSRTCMIQANTEHGLTDTILENGNMKEDHSIHPDTDSPCVYASSETETITSQSCSDSILTESFATAKEQITDSSSSTDTLQTCQNQTDHNDFIKGHSDLNTDHNVSGQISVNVTGDISGQTDSQNTDANIQDEENTLTKESDVDADLQQKDGSHEKSQSDTDQPETVSINEDKAVNMDNTADKQSQHMDLDDGYL